MAAGDGTSVGQIFGRLGFRFDSSGSREFDQARQKHEQQTREPIKQELGFEVDNRALADYHRELDKVRARTTKRDEFKAKLGGDFDPRAFRAYESEMRKAERDAQRMEAQQLKLAASTDKSTRGFDKGSASVETFARTMRGLFDQAGKITAVGVALQGVSAAGAALGGLAAGLAPLAGGLAAYPALASAAAQGIGVFKLATANVFEAVGGLNERLDENSKKFKELDSQAQSLARELDQLKQPIRDLSDEAQKGLFPGLEEGIKDAAKNLPVFRGIVRETADALGDLARQAGETLGSSAWGRDFETQGDRNTVTIRRAGETALNLADALRHVTLAAGPLVDWLTRSAVQFSDLIDKQARAGRESGTLARFFEQTRVQMSRVARIAADVATALVNIGKQAYPLGNDLLRVITLNAEKFKDWTESAKGENAIRDFFDRARPAIDEVGRLLVTVTRMFFRLGNGEQVAPLLHTIRTELLPALEKVVDSTTKSFGPAFIDAVTQALLLFSHIAGSSGPLVQFTKLLAAILTGLNDLIDRVPALGTALSAVIALGGIAKALQIAAALTGVNKLISLLRVAKVEAATTTAVAGAGGAAGAAGATPLLARALQNPVGRAGAVGVGIAAASQIPLEGRTDGFGLPTSGGGRSVAGAVGLGGVRDAIRRSDLLSDARGQLEQFGDMAEKTFAKVRKAGDRVGLLRLAADARNLAERFPDAAAKLEQFANAVDKAARPLTALRRLFGRERISADDLLDPNAAEQLASNFTRIRRDGVRNISDLRENMAFNVKQITKAFAEGTPAWSEAMSKNISVGIRAVRRGMRDGSISAEDGTKQIARFVKKNMELAAGDLDHLSDRGRARLATNFHDAADAVKAQMERAGRVTKTGMREVRDLLAQELQVYGFSLREARNELKPGTRFDGGPDEASRVVKASGGWIRRAMGGWIGGRGRVSGDVVPIEPGVLAAYGEYDANGPGGRRAILSRHQTPVAEMALAAGGYPSLDALPRGNQLGIIERALAPLGGLDRLFASVTTPHYLARGGYAGVSGDTDFSPVLGRALSALARAAGTPIFVQSGRRTVAEQLALGPSTPGHPVAGPNGPHVRGIAADITPGYSVFGALARRFGLGFTVMPQEPWHIQLLNSVGGLGSVALASVPRVVVRGGGHVGRVVQGALDMARSGANRLLTNAGSIAPLGESSPVSAGGFSKARLAGLWIRAGGPSPIANLMAAIARAESGGNPNAYNPSGATGLWQILGAILPGNLRDPMVNARNAVAKYRTQGLGAWETYTNGAYRSFLTRGGRALKFNGGGYVPQKGLGYVPATQQSIKGYIPGGKGLLKGPAATGLRPSRDGVDDYDRIAKTIAREEKAYDLQERRYNQTDETLVNDDGSLNAGGIAQRVNELQGLVVIRQRIVAYYQRMETIARRAVDVYELQIGRLRKSLRHAKGKDRTGITAQIKKYAGLLNGDDGWRARLEALGFDVQGGQLDVSALTGEIADVQGTRPNIADVSTTTDPGTADAGLTADQQAQLAQVERLQQIVSAGDFLNASMLRTLAPFDTNAVGRQVAASGGSASASGILGGQSVDLGNGVTAPAGTPVQVTQITINTLSPSDPQTLAAVAKAANAGNTYLGYVPASNVPLGV
jgi:hypothetical protein